MLGGLAYALGPSRGYVGALLFCELSALIAWDLIDRTPEESASRSRRIALLEFVVLGLVGLVGLFSATHVGEPLAGRFVVFAALMLALVGFAVARTRSAGLVRNAGVIVAALLTAVALYRVGVKYHLAGREQEVVLLNVTVSSSYPSGPPKASGAHVLVAPPSYPWMERGGRR